MGRLQDKTIIVTGGAKGIGAADCRLMVGEGARVVIADTDVDAGHDLEAELGPNTLFVRHDVTQAGSWVRLVEATVGRFGKLDGLVNNAAVLRMHTPETVEIEDCRAVMSVSVEGTVLGCKHVLPAMKASGGGSIINMSSIGAINGEPVVSAYTAAKGAVEAYTRTVAVYCAQARIPVRCNSVHPGVVDTPMSRSVGALMAEMDLSALGETPSAGLVNPVASPNDIAWLVVYLASDESRFVSGQKFVVDGTVTVTPGRVPA